MKLLLALSLTLVATACGMFEKEEEKKPAAPKNHVVAVVDEGFDIENGVFQRDNITAYKALCINTTKNPLLNLAPETRYEDLKRDYINFMDNQSDCVTKPKANDNISASFANISGEFNLWNAAVKDGKINTYPHTKTVKNILDGEKGKFNYHGTATAGLIARDNPDTEILLIEPELLQLMLPNDLYLNKGCRTQAEIDLKARLFEDKEVREIFIDPKREDADSVILKLMKKHKVTMINESYGPSSAAEVHDYHRKLGCKPVKLKRWIVAESKLAQDRQNALEKKLKYKPLHIRAAGNAGKDLNEIGDTLDPCYDDDNYLIVGATDRNDRIAKFSNTGRCVEVYTLGADVITDAPRDFLNVQDGTSFSAPLMTRWLTLNSKPGEEEESLRQMALAATDIDNIIQIADWNKDFAYKTALPEPQPRPNDPNNNNQPQPQPEPQPNTWQAGWTDQLVTEQYNGCKQEVINLGHPDATADQYCNCAITGIAKKYTLEQYNAMNQDQITQDPIIVQCRQQAFGNNPG